MKEGQSRLLASITGGGGTGSGGVPPAWSDTLPCIWGPRIPQPRPPAEGADLGEGRGQGLQQKNLVCTVRAVESLLLQYTLTKIESHFISIQQQQQQKEKNSFLDCYTANFFPQRLLYTITVAKREGGRRPGLGWGQEVARQLGCQEQGGGGRSGKGAGERGPEDHRGSGLCSPLCLSPPLLAPTPDHLGGVRAGEREGGSLPDPGISCWVTSLGFLSGLPCTPPPRGQLSGWRGQGAIALFTFKKTGEGRAITPDSASSALSSWLSVSLHVLQGPPTPGSQAAR